MIVEILISILGFLLFRNELLGNFKYFGLTLKQQSTFMQISVVFFALLTAFVFIFSISSLILIFIIGLFIFSLKFLSFFVEKWIETSLPHLYLEILDEIILSVQVGSSVKSALQKSLAHREGWQHHLWSSALDVMTGKLDLEQIRSKNKRKVFQELCELINEKFKLLDTIKLIRHHLKMELNLRRKSRQASQQARTQSILLSLFYLLGVIFLTTRFGFSTYPRILLGSFVLFLLGLVLMWWMTRRQKWDL